MPEAVRALFCERSDTHGEDVLVPYPNACTAHAESVRISRAFEAVHQVAKLEQYPEWRMLRLAAAVDARWFELMTAGVPTRARWSGVS